MIELYDHAKELFDLDVVVGGATRKSHMLAAGYTEDELVKSEKPILIANVFDWFCDLRTSRKHNGYSLMAIEYSEMHAYFSMRGINVEKWQIDVIRMLDSLSLDAHRERK